MKVSITAGEARMQRAEREFIPFTPRNWMKTKKELARRDIKWGAVTPARDRTLRRSV